VDHDNRRIAVTDPEGNETQTKFDADGNKFQTIDAAGNEGKMGEKWCQFIFPQQSGNEEARKKSQGTSQGD
jgi:YD repeat-containing protein